MLTSLFLKTLNREAAAPRSKAGEILNRLPLREGGTVADLGSGGGYFTLAFAGKVGEKGKVYAIDRQPKYLGFIGRLAEKERLVNIVLVNAKEMEQKLPSAGLDLIFARNVFHHLPQPAAYFQKLKTFLKPEGRVVIIEHRPQKGMGFVALFKHHTSHQTIEQEMDQAGYRLLESMNFLPDQTFNVFGLK
ncbi:MAG: class I SAM-dependent methyltransferase [Thermodesulfobacteriota bacterium]